MTQYVAYYRFSTDKQGMTGLGMDAKREAVTRFMLGRGTVVAEFIEVKTGRKASRPRLNSAIADRRAVLVIAKLDRLAHNVHFFCGLTRSDVEFIAVDMSTASRPTIHILAAFAEHGTERPPQRTKAALDAAKARGTKLGNPRAGEAAALAQAAKTIKPPPEVLKLVADWNGQGRGLREIGREMNHRNIRNPQGHQMYAHTMSRELWSENGRA